MKKDTINNCYDVVQNAIIEMEQYINNQKDKEHANLILNIFEDSKEKINNIMINLKNSTMETKQDIERCIIERFELISEINDNMDDKMEETFEVLLDLPYSIKNILKNS